MTNNISDGVIIATAIVMAITTIIPIITIVILMIKKKLSPAPFFCGMGAFFVSQIILRIPIMNMLSNYSWYKNFITTAIGLIIVGGFTAGLFEETARFISARFILKNKRSYKDTISFGLGHGLCEVIILVGMTMINNLILMIMINNGSIDTITSVMSDENAHLLISSLQSVTIGDLILSIIERISAVMYHVFATVLIFKGVREHKISYYFLAILAHTAFNSVIIIPNKYIIEAVLLVVSSIATVYTVRAKKSFNELET